MPNVLVVDDLATDRCLVGGILESDSILEVRFATNGVEALQKIREGAGRGDPRAPGGRMNDRAPGLAIEAATEHVEVLVHDGDGAALAHVVEEVGHGHTRRLTSLVAQALERAGVAPRELRRVAVDLGPGSFTGVRAGLATAEAIALASGAALSGASSLASLALSPETQPRALR